jgi:hypothetical protein
MNGRGSVHSGYSQGVRPRGKSIHPLYRLFIAWLNGSLLAH